MTRMEKLAGKKPKPYVATAPERRTFNNIEAAAIFGVSAPTWKVIVGKYEKETGKKVGFRFKLRGEQPRCRYTLAAIDELVLWMDSKR